MSVMLRPELLAVAQRLLDEGGDAVSLDRIADALEPLAVDSEEIDALFAWLEARGRVIGDARVGPASAALPQVLASARALRTRLGRVPKPSEVAEHAGLSEAAVRRALLFAKILQR
jgi:hypothetical protein